jgi:hypothetical protein
MNGNYPAGCTQDVLDRAIEDDPGPESEADECFEQLDAEAGVYYEWLDSEQDVDRRATDLAAGIENRLAGSVPSAPVNGLEADKGEKS